VNPEKAQLIVDGLKEAGINFAVALPDSQIHEVFEKPSEVKRAIFDCHECASRNSVALVRLKVEDGAR